jgi:hypothetical protein
MEKPYLTVSEFYNQVNKRKTKKKANSLREYIEKLDENYNIISLNEKDNNEEECSSNYPESYIVNQSNKRFKNEIKNSHFIHHWKDLCKYPEIAGSLRLIYNLINLKKDELINLLYEVTNKEVKIFNEKDVNFDKIVNFIGLNNQVSRIKVDNKSGGTVKKDIKLNDDNHNTNLNNNLNTNRKMLINLTLIVKLDKMYPRNLLACPLDKSVLVERNHRKNFNFVCHKHNMIERLKTNMLCLSVWLFKNKKVKNKNSKKNNETEKWVTKLKMGTSYLSDTFPGEKGTINDFMKEVVSLGYSKEAALYLSKIREAIKENYFYAVEANDPRIKLLVNKKTKKQKKKIE